MLTLKDMDLKHKKILLREDFNVPLLNGRIRDTSRIDRALPTLHKLMDQNAKILILSHLGRPARPEYDPSLSLQPIAAYLSQRLGRNVGFSQHWLETLKWDQHDIILAENIRFLPGETKNDPQLAKQMAQQFDVFVMDAFACAHRAHASTVGICTHIPHCCAGPLFLEEIQTITSAIEHPRRPLVAIVGGAKVSTKFTLLKQLITQVDYLIVGGGIANTFLAAAGCSIGASLFEADFIEHASELLTHYGDKIPLPIDVCCAESLTAEPKICTQQSLDPKACIFDIGPQTISQYQALIQQAKTILWNGPVGVFENQHFAVGTQAIAKAIAASTAYSLVGGGDTIAAVKQFGVQSGIDYISTGGGAFLHLLEGEPLPSITALQKGNKL